MKKDILMNQEGNLIFIVGLVLAGVVVTFVALGVLSPTFYNAKNRLTDITNPDAISSTKEELLILEKAIYPYEKELGRAPERLQDLLRKPPGSEGWQGPYIKGEGCLVDAWGSPYRYDPFRRKIISPGPDKREGTPDDLSVTFRTSPAWEEVRRRAKKSQNSNNE